MTPWTAALTAVGLVQAAQAWHLYKVSGESLLAAAEFTALPGLAAIVMLAVLWFTGVSVLGFAAAGASGFAVQLLGEMLQMRRAGRQSPGRQS